MPPETPITSRSLNKAELGVHLSVACSKTLKKVLKTVNLDAVIGSYPWRRIWRAVHRTEGSWLAGHLAQLKAQHQDSPILTAIDDLEVELTEPLWRFDQMARAIGKVPNTFSRALKEGRATLPIATLQLGPRLRCYPPLEVRLWRDEGILLDLPQPVQLVARNPDAAVEDTTEIAAPEAAVAAGTNGTSIPTPSAKDAGSNPAPKAADQAKKAVFGAFDRGSRKNTA